jgi:phosphoadenosine phosphosulfate reductase
MSLVDYNLFTGEKENKVEIAIELLKTLEPPEGYYFKDSGGKDSSSVKRLLDMAGVKYESHNNNTTCEPPELRKFLKDYHPDTIIEHPEITMWRLIVKKMFPPYRHQVYCCEVLKERTVIGHRIVLGIRAAESRGRAQRRCFETAVNDPAQTIVNPILYWSDADVWEFHRVEKIPYCGLYDEGFKRLGCIMCPKAGGPQMMKEAKRWPKYYEAYLRAFDRMLEARRQAGKTTKIGNTAEEVMYWWMRINNKKPVPQPVFEAWKKDLA